MIKVAPIIVIFKKNSTFVFFSQLSIMVYGGSFLLYLPFFLNQTEIGIWFTIIALGGLNKLADLGFGNLVITYTAYFSKCKDKSFISLISFFNNWQNRIVIILYPFFLIFGAIVFYYSGELEHYPFLSYFSYLLGLIAFFYIQRANYTVEGLGYIKLAHTSKGILYLFSAFFTFIFVLLKFSFFSLPLGIIFSSVLWRLIIYPKIKNQIVKMQTITQKKPDYSHRELNIEFTHLLKRSSISWISGYTTTQGIVLFSYCYAGATVSATVGYILNIMISLVNLSNVFILEKVSVINLLIAERKISEALLLRKKSESKSLISFFFSGSIFFIVFIFFLKIENVSNIDVLCAFFSFYLSFYILSRSIFIRAFKIEPFVFPSICSLFLFILATSISSYFELYFFGAFLSNILFLLLTKKLNNKYE